MIEAPRQHGIQYLHRSGALLLKTYEEADDHREISWYASAHRETKPGHCESRKNALRQGEAAAEYSRLSAGF